MGFSRPSTGPVSFHGILEAPTTKSNRFVKYQFGPYMQPPPSSSPAVGGPAPDPGGRMPSPPGSPPHLAIRQPRLPRHFDLSQTTLGDRLNDVHAFRFRHAQCPIRIHATPLARLEKTDYEESPNVRMASARQSRCGRMPCGECIDRYSAAIRERLGTR